MPKEYVKSGNVDVVAIWQRDRSVQVSTVFNQDNPLVHLMEISPSNPSDLQRELMAKIRDVIARGEASGSSSEVVDGSSLMQITQLIDQYANAGGWYAGLDRNQCNQLINLLRRARNSAYGKDA